MSWLLQIMLQYTRGHVYLKELVLSFSWDKYSQVELIAGSYDSSLSVSLSLSLSFFKVSPSYFPQWLHQFTSPPILHTPSLFSVFLPKLIPYLFDKSHADSVKGISLRF